MLLVLVGIALAGGAVLAIYLLPAQYQATAQIVMLSNAGQLTQPADLAAGQVLARNYAALAKSDAVLLDAARALGGRYSSEDLRGRLMATPSKESFYLTLAASSTEPQDAANIVNAASGAFLKRVEGVQAQVAAPVIANLQDEIGTLNEQLKTIDARITANTAQDSAIAGDPSAALLAATVRNQTLATLLDSRSKLQERLSAANDQLRLLLSKQKESAVLWSPALPPDHAERLLPPLLALPLALALFLTVAVFVLLHDWRASAPQTAAAEAPATRRARSQGAQGRHVSQEPESR